MCCVEVKFSPISKWASKEGKSAINFLIQVRLESLLQVTYGPLFPFSQRPVSFWPACASLLFKHLHFRPLLACEHFVILLLKLSDLLFQRNEGNEA